MHPDRPLPSPNPLTVNYWKATHEHRLALPQCRACGRYHSYPRTLCPFCASADLEWKPLKGSGTIYSWTEVFRAPSKAFAEEVPYVIAIIELDEGPHLMSRIVTPDKAELAIGARVAVEFEEAAADISLPVFRITDA